MEIVKFLSLMIKVAREFSEDKARDGGNLGWMTRQQMWYAFLSSSMPLRLLILSGEFQKQAFSATIGQYVGPFKTQHGYAFFVWVMLIR